jgi:hypothetical protein
MPAWKWVAGVGLVILIGMVLVAALLNGKADRDALMRDYHKEDEDE